MKLDINHYFVARALFGSVHRAPFRLARVSFHSRSAEFQFRDRLWEGSALSAVTAGRLLTMMKPSVYRFVAAVVEAARKTTRPRRQPHATDLLRTRSSVTLLAVQSFPVSGVPRPYKVLYRFVASNGLFGALVEDSKWLRSGMDSRRRVQGALLAARWLFVSSASLLTAPQADLCRCPYHCFGRLAAANGENISMARAAAPAAAPKRLLGVLVPHPLQPFPEKWYSGLAGFGLVRAAAGWTTDPTCSDLWGAWESLDTWTCIRSRGLGQTLGLKAHLQIPHTGRKAEPGSRAEATQKSDPGEEGPERATDAIAHRHIAGPSLWLLEAVRLHPSQQTRPGPLAEVCRLATKPEECRAPSASARAAGLPAVSSLPPASVSLPRLWPRDRLASTPRKLAATREPPETGHAPALEGALAEVESAAPGMTLTAEEQARVVVVQNSEETVGQVPWPPEGAARGEVRTWAGRVGSSSAVVLEEVSGLPGISGGEKVGRCLAAWGDHGQICSRNVLAG